MLPLFVRKRNCYLCGRGIGPRGRPSSSASEPRRRLDPIESTLLVSLRQTLRILAFHADIEGSIDARVLLRGEVKAKGLKALLAVAPLEGIDLTRARDLGRDVAL